MSIRRNIQDIIQFEKDGIPFYMSTHNVVEIADWADRLANESEALVSALSMSSKIQATMGIVRILQEGDKE